LLTIKNLTAKNFLSTGNVSQAINLDRKDLTLVLGENLDLGGDGSRNGTGKSAALSALSYALYGHAISNIKKDNLINRTNMKGMLVTVEFEKNNIKYRIERGRKPGILALYIGDTAFESKDNDAQGDSRETQHEIDKIIGMGHDMFKHIVVLNTYTEPFLRLKSNDQRAIIEELLGITMLSEKAEKLKEEIKKSKDTITSEEYRINATIESNKRIEEQIAGFRKRQAAWETKLASEVISLQDQFSKLLEIDIDAELKNHELLALYTQKQKDISELESALLRSNKDLTREQKGIEKLTNEIENLKNHTCHSCGQEIHDDKQEELLKTKLDTLEDHIKAEREDLEIIESINEGLAALGDLGVKPKTYYAKKEDADHHKSSIAHLEKSLEDKLNTEDPYAESIREMEATAIVAIDYAIINNTTKLKEHQELLFKLLTNKDSFIRKRIIDQNLTYLNSLLSSYLDKLGLPHTVVFQNDLSVQIEELGRDLDFDGMSRGESTRVILALSLAFRGVYESLYGPINLLMIDELVDNGMDTNGVENSMGILKRMSRETNKSIWLISHKDDLASRVDNILKVVKTSGFTEWQENQEG
jgi:DNA repair exonuclease SbcCD ATPase subunit